MSPEKMIGLFLPPAGGKLCEAFFDTLSPTIPRTSQAGGAFRVFMRYAFLCVSSFTMAKPRNSTMPTICTGASGSPSSSTDTSTDTMGSM